MDFWPEGTPSEQRLKLHNERTPQLLGTRLLQPAMQANEKQQNHTMLRVRDPQKSLEYYKYLGLTQINKLSYPENKFDLYFLGTSSATSEKMPPLCQARV